MMNVGSGVVCATVLMPAAAIYAQLHASSMKSVYLLVAEVWLTYCYLHIIKFHLFSLDCAPSLAFVCVAGRDCSRPCD